MVTRPKTVESLQFTIMTLENTQLYTAAKEQLMQQSKTTAAPSNNLAKKLYTVYFKNLTNISEITMEMK